MKRFFLYFLSVLIVFSMVPVIYASAEEDYTVIDTFESAEGIISNHNLAMTDSENQKAGDSCLSTTGETNIYLMHQSNPYDIALPDDVKDCYFECWLYVSNVSAVNASSAFEISQEIDKCEIQWRIIDLDLKDGWNKLVLPLSKLDPNMKKLNFIRLFMFLNDGEEVTMKIDDLCLVRNINPTDFSKLDGALAKAAEYTDTVLADYSEQSVKRFKNAVSYASDTAGFTSRDIDVAADNITRAITELSSLRETSLISDKTVNTCGRTYYDDAGGLHFNWTNSGFSFSFTGTEAAVKLKGNGSYINVYIDDSDEPSSTILVNGTKSYVVVTGLDDAAHTVKLLKRSENGWGGTASASEITVLGKINSVPSEPVRKIEVIGDSITCGYGNLISDGSVNAYRSGDQDGTKTYATIMADNFGAECSVIAKSGIGFAFNNGGGTTGTMKELYAYTDAPSHGADDAWDFEANKNDIVVIALGTNDTCAPSSDSYYNGAKEFYTLVREKNPDSIIIWAYEIMTASYADRLQQVVREANDAGDKNVYYYALGLINRSEDGIGAAGHPSMATHVKDAAGFTDFVSEVTGWIKETDGTEAPEKLRLKKSSSLSFDTAGSVIIAPVKGGSTVKDFKNEFYDSQYIAVFDNNKKELADDDIVSTGASVCIMYEARKLDTRDIAVFGDVNADGDITAADALLTLQHSVGKITLTGEKLSAAGVKKADSVSAADALLILQYSVGKITEF